MSASPDIDRRIDAFLADGIDRLPDQVYDAVRAEIDRARRPAIDLGLPSFDRQAYARLSIAAAVVVVIVAAVMLPGLSGFGGVPSARPSMPETPAPLPSGPPSPDASGSDWQVTLPIGRHRAESAGVVFTFDVESSGWVLRREFRAISINRSDLPQSGVLVGRPTWIATGACNQPLPASIEGASAAEMADAMASIPGLDATGPTDRTVGDRSAKYLELEIRSDVACPAHVALWWGPGGPWRNGTAGNHLRAWIVDIDGNPLLLESQTDAAPTASERARLDALVATFRFEATSDR